MNEVFHYPPEIFNLLAQTIPLLCRSKKDVIIFFQGAGVDKQDLADVSRRVNADHKSISKYEIAREVLTNVNKRGDIGLAPRREIIKRVTEFDSFDTCWDTDKFKAKGLVAEIREKVNVKDSFTRMKQERDSERKERISRQQAEQEAAKERKKQIDDVNKRLTSLFRMDDNPQARGKALESVLNDLFKAYGIFIIEDFKRRDPNTGSVLEQIDGIIAFDGDTYIVEMKWLKGLVGVPEISQHLVRVYNRGNVNGIFIAANGYTSSAVEECRSALSQKTIFLFTLKEFVMLLQRQGDLIELLKKKKHAAIIEKKPFLEII